ncbi:MAG: FecR domain-containing protein [Polaromonas sp.]|nr:FecR domain-containing protein [Polaromonas sp.]
MKTRTKPDFQLQNAILLVALATAYPVSALAAASAGIAQFAVGDVTLRRADGKTDALVKGKDIGSGESIVTGQTGRAQVKFSDGGVVSLQPNTEFKISNYVDQGDPKEDRFLVDLLRGSMRAITGLIGKRNRENYKVITTTATIGIRGSGFSAGYNPDGSLGVTTEFDGIEVCNGAGCVGLTAGESVVVVSNNAAPVRTNTRADVPTPQTKQDPVVVGNKADASGKNEILETVIEIRKAEEKAASVPPRLLTGVAFTSFSLTSVGLDQRNSVSGAILVGDGTAANANVPRAYVAELASVGTATGTGNTTVIATSGSLATGDYMVLGTWGGANWVTPNGSSSQTTVVGATAYAAGVPSPVTALSTLNGMRASYALQNATPVFSTFGGPGTLLGTSKLNVDFIGAGAYADINLDISFPPASTNGSTTPYNLRGGITSASVGLNGTLAVSGPACSGPSAFCGYGAVSGGFSGPNAQNALLSFGAISQPNGAFGGAASFAKGASQATPTNNSMTDISVVLTDGSGNVTNNRFNSEIGQTVTPSFYGEKLVSLAQTTPNSPATTLQSTPSQTPARADSFAALGVISDPDFLGWGNWVTGNKQTSSTGKPTSTLLDSVHYVVGRPTPSIQMPTSGVATYSNIGGTAPTATLNGMTTTGKLLDALLTADFAKSAVSANIFTRFTSTSGAPTDVTVNQSATFARGSANFSGSSSYASISGFFTGNNAARAGLVYNAQVNALGNITGAAAFQRSN